MPLINRIGQMKKEGLDEGQIAQRLREEGVSPREIDEAFDQNQVKSAVGTYEDVPTDMPPSREFPRESGREFASQPVSYSQFPQPAEQIAENQTPFEEQTLLEVPQQPEEGSPQQPENIQQEEQYPEYQYQPETPPIDTEMITDLIEQITDEKTGEIQKTISELSKFKAEIQGKVDSLNERLKRIEQTIDRLQASVIGQIGNYGRNISDLKKEMVMTQESFSKILNPLSDHLEELRKIAAGLPKPSQEKTKSATGTKKDGFHSYMR